MSANGEGDGPEVLNEIVANEEKIIRLLFTLGEIGIANLHVAAIGKQDAQNSTIRAIGRLQKQLEESIGDLVNPSE